MKRLINLLLRVIVFIVVIGSLVFDVLLYRFCERQKTEINSMKDQQKLDSQVNSNEFKYQQEKIELLSKTLEAAEQQIKTLNDVLIAEKDENKSIQTSLVDIKAGTDAMKQDMQGWQKDYASVLVQLKKKMDDSKSETRDLKESINSLKASIDKLSLAGNSLPDIVVPPEKKSEDQL